MPSVALLPALSLVLGVAAGLTLPVSPSVFAACLLAAIVAAAALWCLDRRLLTSAAIVVGFVAAGAADASHQRNVALDTSLRRLLDRAFGGFAPTAIGPGGRHDPVPTRAMLLEDAAVRDDYVSLRVRVTDVFLAGAWQRAAGDVVLSVTGAASGGLLAEWRAGRSIEAPLTFRRPARYLDEGVPDFERDLALDGVTLLGSVKSGLLVHIRARGGWLNESAAAARVRIRSAIARWVGARSPTSAALVAAVLIGDRAAIPDEVRDQLQAAGTYHVIAISGGNIAVFVVLVSALCALAGLGPRPAAVLTIVALLAYANVVVSGPSVRRAVLVALVYLGARAIDHRAAPWHVAAIACAAMLVVWPLDLRDAGFVLTFGAAAALVASAPAVRTLSARVPPARWLIDAVAASLVVEAALLPVQAIEFSRVTLAGIGLNLIAVPAMTIAQLAGLLVVALDLAGTGAAAAGWLCHAAVRALVDSASLLEVAPWLARRVPAPAVMVVVAYYLGLAVVAWAPFRARIGGGCVCGLTAGLMVFGLPHVARTPGQMRLTMLDVGQGEAMLLEGPAGSPILVDAGGSPFGSAFDMGTRVVAPALWARGVGALASLLITHGDPDHAGGAPGVLDSLSVAEAWFGVRVARNRPGEALLADLAERHVAVRYLRAGESLQRGAMLVRVLHPPEPDWERPRVRNDDSVVLEAAFGDVAVVLTGDISAEVERAIVPQLTRAPIRVLKVAHHGSRTSSSQDLLDAWQPQLALISAGRGNSFGHPAPDVLARLEAARVQVLRTDRDGQITLEVDGRSVRWRTYTGRTGEIVAR